MILSRLWAASRSVRRYLSGDGTLGERAEGWSRSGLGADHIDNPKPRESKICLTLTLQMALLGPRSCRE